MRDMTPERPDPERRKSIKLYALLAASLLATMIPTVTAAVLSCILLPLVLIIAYRVRGKVSEGSLTENHATFIIRTIWIGMALSCITLAIGGGYLIAVIDYSPFIPCAEQFAAGGLDPNTDPATLYAAMAQSAQGCMDNFMLANKQSFLLAGLVTIAPDLLYFLVRFARGFSRALHGWRIADPKAWF